jgi:hypothetical protein
MEPITRPDTFPTQNHLNQGDALSPLLFNFTLVYTIKKIQDDNLVLKLNGTRLLIVYADDVNLFGGNKGTINKDT